ncbi:MAG: DUF547 domain-containing protein [Desulfobaccales bacterium]
MAKIPKKKLGIGSMILLGAMIAGFVSNPVLSLDRIYGEYAALLSEYVDPQGMVNYRTLKGNPQGLKAFQAALAQTTPEVYQQWRDEEKIAFWINAYNALTLKAIIDHYPIRASFFKGFVYPRNSIRQIPGVWDSRRFPVMGKSMTLDEIEHGVLRKDFNEPRIHLALVCAAMGCPPLRNEPYEGDKLDRQLHDQARVFLANPKKFRLDQGRGKVLLSPIFKWFGGDFVKTYGTDKAFQGFSPEERAVLNFLSGYVSDSDRDYLRQGKYTISYLDYDWSLNQQ